MSDAAFYAILGCGVLSVLSLGLLVVCAVRSELREMRRDRLAARRALVARERALADGTLIDLNFIRERRGT
jgi:hypothetical protein